VNAIAAPRVRRRARAGATALGAPVVAVVVWQWWGQSSDPRFFPPPSRIASAIGDRYVADGWEAVGDTVGASVQRALLGFAIGSVLAVTVGVALGSSTWLSRIFSPSLHFVRSLPPTAVVPLFMLLFGIGTTMQVSVIAFGSSWPVLVNTVDGVRAVEPGHLQAARAFRIGRARTLLRVVLPSAAPKVAAGMRISLSLSLVLVVIVEMVGSSGGLGLEVVQAQRSFQVERMWAGLVLLAGLGVALNACFTAVERRALAWHVGSRGAPTNRGAQR
jgi:ABC-type nitrate/sulfonate/bicarbonate transport system permease component